MSSNIEERSIGLHTEPILRPFLGDVDIFVPLAEEADYFKKYGIDVRHYSSGITLIGVTRVVSDNATARLDFTFPSGSCYEPVGKSGINHLLEHLISNRPGNLSRVTECHYNAFTSSTELRIEIGGIANPLFPAYGVWPVVSAVIHEIVDPLEIDDITLENEKEVVISEMRQGATNYEKRRYKLFNEVVFASDHPTNYTVIGTEPDVRSVTLDEIRRRQDEIIIPNGMEVTVFGEGDPYITETLLKELDQSFKNIPQSQHEPMRVSDAALSKINPEFQNGKYFIRDTGLNNGTVAINYLWLMPELPYFTAESIGCSGFFTAAAQRMQKFFRSAGIGYDSNIFDLSLGTKMRIFGFNMNIPTPNDIEDFARSVYPKLKKCAFDTYNQALLIEATERMKIRQMTVPTPVSQRLNDVSYGIKHHNRIIDSDKVKKIYKMITPEHLRSSLDIFSAILPAIVVVGDLHN